MLILKLWAGHMQALPIFLDDMFNEFVAVLLSVTLVLAFGEVWLIFSLPFQIFSLYRKRLRMVGIVELKYRR